MGRGRGDVANSPPPGESDNSKAAHRGPCEPACEAAEDAFWSYGLFQPRNTRRFPWTPLPMRWRPAPENHSPRSATAESGLPEASSTKAAWADNRGTPPLGRSHPQRHASRPSRDEALPDRQPMPPRHPHVSNRPIGPVAVLARRIFPLRFSTAGGGHRGCRWRAGCPVVVQRPLRPPRPRVEIVAESDPCRGFRNVGIHPRCLFHSSMQTVREVVRRWLQHPLIKAVGLYRALVGAAALFDLLPAATPKPIPFFA